MGHLIKPHFSSYRVIIGSNGNDFDAITRKDSFDYGVADQASLFEPLNLQRQTGRRIERFFAICTSVKRQTHEADDIGWSQCPLLGGQIQLLRRERLSSVGR